MAEPQSVGAVLESMRERLARMGMDPALVDVAPADEPHGESPEDRADRLALQARNRAARWRARLPVMYQEATLDSLYPDSEHRQDVRSWLPGGAWTLLLAGTVGAGKTHAAYAIGNAAVDQGQWVEAWGLTYLLEALRPGGDADAADRVRDCDLLILDDLQALKVSDWAQEQMTALLDHRQRHNRRQVVTTNIPSADLATAWGARFMDRLMYRAQVLVYVRESRRERSW